MRVPGQMEQAMISMVRGETRSSQRDPRCYILTGAMVIVDNEPVWMVDSEEQHLATCGLCGGEDGQAMTARNVIRPDDEPWSTTADPPKPGADLRELD